MATTTHSGSQSTRSPRRLQHHRSRSWLTTLFKKQVAAAGDTAGREPSEDQDDARQAWGTTIEYEARGDVLQEDPLYSQQQSCKRFCLPRLSSRLIVNDPPSSHGPPKSCHATAVRFPADVRVLRDAVLA